MLLTFMLLQTVAPRVDTTSDSSGGGDTLFTVIIGAAVTILVALGPKLIEQVGRKSREPEPTTPVPPAVAAVNRDTGGDTPASVALQPSAAPLNGSRPTEFASFVDRQFEFLQDALTDKDAQLAELRAEYQKLAVEHAQCLAHESDSGRHHG